MISESNDSEKAELHTRLAQAEAAAEYVVKTQDLARLSTQTKYVNMDTGEVSWGKPFENTPPAATATETVAPDGGPGSLAGDPDAGARHVKIAITFVLVVILTWVWFAQKRAAARAS